MKSELINVRPDARKESNGCNGTLEREEWRDVVGYEGLYQVSSFGRVKSLARLSKRSDGNYQPTPTKILVPICVNGYCAVGLHLLGKQKMNYIHRLVADAFVPNPDNLPQVNHRNEDKTCNIPDNLEWCDSKYNINYGTRNKRHSEKINSEPIKQKMIDSKRGTMKPVIQLTLDGEFVKEWESMKEVARVFGIHRSGIQHCCKGKQKTYKGFIWKYKSDYENEQRQ